MAGQALVPGDVITPEQQIKEPYVLEFLDLKDEYRETDLETALIAKLESFLLELGGDFGLPPDRMAPRPCPTRSF